MNAPIPAASVLMLALAELDDNGPYQQRRTKASAEADAGLAESIRRLGVLQPILVRWNAETQQHQVVDGHRRVAAARVAGLERIRAFGVDSTDDRETMAAGVAANHQRAPLAPVDLWRAMVHLQDLGWKVEGAALALGIPMRLARQLDKLGRLHPDMIAEIERLDRASGHVAPPADPTADPVLQLRYDVLVREVQRERTDGVMLRSALRTLQAEAAKMRVALGLEHDGTPRLVRNMDAGHG